MITQDDCQNTSETRQNDSARHSARQSFIAEYLAQVRRTLTILLVWGAIVIINTLIVTDITVTISFLVGYVSSVLYYLFMCYRVKKSSDMPVFRAVGYMRYGWIVRLCFILSVLIIAIKTPGIKLSMAVLGLVSLQIVIVFDAVVIVTAGLMLRRKGK